VIKALIVFGTRPEAIKLVPIIKLMENYPSEIEFSLCITSQHREMLEQVLNFFKIHPDYDLGIMKHNQGLFYITSEVLRGMEGVIEEYKPDIMIVQGDATSAFAGALAGFYKKVKIAHIEAGLRSFNKYSPFPEELNRVLISHLADYHFVPTEKAKENLFKEGIVNNVYVVGNTVIDALFITLDIIENDYKLKKEVITYFHNLIPGFSRKILDDNKTRIILVTAHRRESFGKPFENICMALREISKKRNDVQIIYPVHLNPNVSETVFETLKNASNIHLIPPLDYPHLIWLMSKSYLVLTDSGGIQEEAPSLGKPVLVMREVTERIEGIEAGTARLVGTEKEKIFVEVLKLLEDKDEYTRMAKAINPYGDGKSADRIVEKMRMIQ